MLPNGAVVIVQETAVLAGGHDQRGVPRRQPERARRPDRARVAARARHRPRHRHAIGGRHRRSARRSGRVAHVGDEPSRDDALLHVPGGGLRRRPRGRRATSRGSPAFPDDEIEKRRGEIDHGDPAGPGQPGRPRRSRRCRRCCTAGASLRPSAKGTVETSSGSPRDDLAAYHARAVRAGGAVRRDCRRRARRATRSTRVAAALDGWNAVRRAERDVPPRAASARRGSSAIIDDAGQAAVRHRLRLHDASAGSIPRTTPYWMMNNILGQFGLGGRLAENIRERQGMAYYAFSSFDPSLGPGPLVVRAGVDPGERRARGRGDRHRGRRARPRRRDGARAGGDAAVT